MILERLFDLLDICKRPMALASLGATIVLGGCAPEENQLTAAVQSASDWMNKVEQAPSPNPWRLSERPELTTGSYPQLRDVPAKPTNLPIREEVQTKIAALSQSQPAPGAAPPRPSARDLGSPPAATVTPISIPSASTASTPNTLGKAKLQRNAPPTAAPALLPPAQPSAPPPLPSAAENRTLDLAAEGTDWFNAQAQDAVKSFAQEQLHTSSLILLMIEAPTQADETVNLVRDQLVSSGIPKDRISVNFREAKLRKVRLRTIGQ
jgi:hypothetical protein